MTSFQKLFFALKVFLFSYFIAGCFSRQEDISTIYKNYTFDTNVIARLPLYDSLVSAVIENLSVFKKHINENDSYKAFRYMADLKAKNILRKLPVEVQTRVEHYLNLLGKKYIYGFDVFNDSTIKIYIRTSWSNTKLIEIGENLSYFPPGKIMKPREFPDKDTIINNQWQYWVRFTEQGIFPK